MCLQSIVYGFTWMKSIKGQHYRHRQQLQGIQVPQRVLHLTPTPTASLRTTKTPSHTATPSSTTTAKDSPTSPHQDSTISDSKCEPIAIGQRLKEYLAQRRVFHPPKVELQPKSAASTHPATESATSSTSSRGIITKKE